MPACLPLVQTLVATKSLALTPSAAASSPVTDSEEPYIGELSITRPPSSTNIFRVSWACAFSFASEATSNTGQVPRPTAGIASPVFGTRPASVPAPGTGPRRSSRGRRPALRVRRRRHTIRRTAEDDGKAQLRRRPAGDECALQPVRAPRRPDLHFGPAAVRRDVFPGGARGTGTRASDSTFPESALCRAGAPRDGQHEKAGGSGRLEHGLPAEGHRVAARSA